MNKNELLNVVVEETGMYKTDIKKVIDTTINSIKHAMAKGEDVRLIGFGTFYVTNRKATKGRNPSTGEVIDIPASKQAKFRAGKDLKDTVNGRK